MIPQCSPGPRFTTSPNLVLNFTTGVLDPRVTYTRNQTVANSATFTGSNGLIQYATKDVPRFNYTPAGVAQGLLIEEQRTNLLTYSGDYTNAAWIKGGLGVTPTAYVSPDGATTAQKIVLNNAATGGIYRATGISSGTAVVSMYIRAAEWNFLHFQAGGSYSPQINCFINLTTGAITGGSTTGVTAVSAGNGWWRLAVPLTYSSATDANFYINPTNASGSDTTGDGTSGIYLWHSQSEAGASPTSLIQTTTAAVTRYADNPSQLTSGWYTSNGTFVASFVCNGYSSSNMVYAVSDGTTNNLVEQYLSSATNLKSTTVGGGSSSTSMDFTVAVGTPYKSAFSYASNNGAASVNGATPVTSATVYVPTGITTLSIGNRSGSNFLNGTIKSLAFYPVTNAAAKLKGLST
jgi:hypothetical protein